MTCARAALSLVLAVAALYGLGLPLAGLLPAPPASPRLHSIAVAPLLAILAGGLGRESPCVRAWERDGAKSP